MNCGNPRHAFPKGCKQAGSKAWRDNIPKSAKTQPRLFSVANAAALDAFSRKREKAGVRVQAGGLYNEGPPNLLSLGFLHALRNTS